MNISSVGPAPILTSPVTDLAGVNDALARIGQLPEDETRVAALLARVVGGDSKRSLFTQMLEVQEVYKDAGLCRQIHRYAQLIERAFEALGKELEAKSADAWRAIAPMVERDLLTPLRSAMKRLEKVFKPANGEEVPA